MNLRSTATCKDKLSKELMKLGYDYTPSTDAVPTLLPSAYNDGKYVFNVGGLAIIVLPGEKYEKIKVVLEQYHVDIREARKFIRPPKVKGPALVVESKTPFTDLQKEIDDSMGVVGGVLGIVFVVIVCIAYFLLTHFA